VILTFDSITKRRNLFSNNIVRLSVNKTTRQQRNNGMLTVAVYVATVYVSLSSSLYESPMFPSSSNKLIYGSSKLLK